MGLAVGDALGATLEFAERDALPHHTQLTGGGPFLLPPGAWTDDTAMALCLADCLLARRRVDRFDFAARLIRWASHGENSCTGACFDIGHTTAAALQELATHRVFGVVGPRTAGNGSIVRCAHLAIAFGHNRQLTRDWASWQSSVTHGHLECLNACSYLALALADALDGLPPHEVLRQAGPWYTPTVATLAKGKWRTKTRDQISSTGYVMHTLEAALWAVHHTRTFEDALVLAVNLAGDADSVGAVTGQLAGALYGYAAIPERWLRPLAWRPHLHARALALHALSDRSTA